MLVLCQELNCVCFCVSTWYSQLLTHTTNQVSLYYKSYGHISKYMYFHECCETLYMEVVWQVLKICMNTCKYHLHPNITYTFLGSFTLVITVHILYGIFPLKYWLCKEIKVLFQRRFPNTAEFNLYVKEQTFYYCTDLLPWYGSTAFEAQLILSYCNCHIRMVGISELSQYTTVCSSIKKMQKIQSPIFLSVCGHL